MMNFPESFGVSPTASVTSPSALASESPLMVMLVDDQMIIGEEVRRMLACEPDIDFHYCADASTAVLLAEQLSPSIILQDMTMPGISGLDMIRYYRSYPKNREVPIIMLSNKDDSSLKGEAFVAGANDYLVKLPDKIELLARIRYHANVYLSRLQRDEAYRALRESQKRLVQTNLELQRLSNLDGLTGLSNRRYANEFLTSEWLRAIREQTPFSILMIDVDEFKRYNDQCGHLAGDEVLKQVADIIQTTVCRPADLAARFGGEEFTVILPATLAEGAQAIGEKIRQNVEELNIPHITTDGHSRVTVSIGGAAVFPKVGESFSSLIHLADQALYEAKRTGRNRVVIAPAHSSTIM